MNNSYWDWETHGCPLGYDCSQMGEATDGKCWNEQDCFAWIEPWDLYDILLLPGLPGAIYIAYWVRKPALTANLWVREPIFKELQHTDWLIYLAATSGLPFEEWEIVYRKLRWSKENYRSAYVLASLWDDFDHLRDKVLGKPETELDEGFDPIPF